MHVLKTCTKPPTLLKVIKIGTIQEFQNLKKDWGHLLSASRTDNIFLTWEWLYTWWETYSKGKELYILLCHDNNGDLIGIAPFYITSEKIMGMSIRILKLIGSEEVCSEYLDVIAKKDKTDEVTKALALYLKNHIKWDILHLRDVLEHCIMNDVLREMKEESNMIFTDTIKTTNPFISLPESEDIFIARFSGTKRHAIKDIVRREKKLTRERGNICYIETDNKNIDQSLRAFIDLHQKLWENRGLPGVFKRKNFLSFHFEVAKRFAENNWLRIYLLSIEDRPVASLYGFQYDNKFYYYQSGFDPDWKGYGVGKILLNYTIMGAIQNKLREYDFLRGDTDYKFNFTDTFRHTKEILVINNKYKAKLYYLHKKIHNHIKETIKTIFPESIVVQARKIRDHITLR